MDSLRAIVAQRSSLADTVHRPWPVPGGRWLVGQSWLDLLFIHWRVDHADLRRLVPAELALDSFNDQYWLGVVPFRMQTVRLAGCPPVLGTSAFPEVNVRTYVVRDGKPGVCFLSLDADNRIAVALGRRLYGLPYVQARVKMRTGATGVTIESTRTQAGWPAAAFAATYRPTGPPMLAAPGTLEHWLTERYCFYTTTHSAVGVRRTEIHHRPWRLQPAVLDLQRNSMLDPFAISQSSMPLIHYSQAQHVVAWPAVRG